VCCRGGRGHGRGWAPVACQVRDHAEEALDYHELRAVVHLMLLHALQHLEAALRRRAVRHRHEFVGLRLRDALHKLRPRVAFGAEQIDDLRLRIRQLLVNGRLLQDRAEELKVSIEEMRSLP